MESFSPFLVIAAQCKRNQKEIKDVAGNEGSLKEQRPF